MRYFRELLALGFTIGGVGLVLLTLTGDTLRYAIWISIGSLTAHLLSVAMDRPDADG